MNPSGWARITTLFNRACDQPAGERRAWLDGAIAATSRCGMRSRPCCETYETDPGFLEQAADVAGRGDRASGRGRTHRPRARTPTACRARSAAAAWASSTKPRRDDQEFDRRAAIKILPAWSGSDLSQRFRLRAARAGRPRSPWHRAPRSTPARTDDGAPYFVMEYVDGQPHRRLCRERALHVRERVALDRARAGRAGLRAPASGDPSRHQARQHSGDGGWPAQAARLRDRGRPDCRRRRERRHDAHRASSLHAGVREPRADPRRACTTASDVYSLGVVLYLLLVGPRGPTRWTASRRSRRCGSVCEVDPPLMSAVADARDCARRSAAISIASSRRRSRSRRASATAPSRRSRPIFSVARRPAGQRHAASRSLYRARALRPPQSRRGDGRAAVVARASPAARRRRPGRRASRAQERDKAQNRFRQVREFSRSLLFDVHDALRAVPGATEPRRLLLDRAVQFLDGLAADAGDDDELLMELAAGYQQLANVQGNALQREPGRHCRGHGSLEKAAASSSRWGASSWDIEALIRSDRRAVRPHGGAERARRCGRTEGSQATTSRYCYANWKNRHDARPSPTEEVAEGYSECRPVSH